LIIVRLSALPTFGLSLLWRDNQVEAEVNSIRFHPLSIVISFITSSLSKGKNRTRFEVKDAFLPFMIVIKHSAWGLAVEFQSRV